MALPKQPVTVRFGKLDQGKGTRQRTILGSLAQAVNVRQARLGRYEKRRGYAKTDRTADSGSITTAQGLASTPDALFLHSDDQMFVRDATNSTWRNRGTQARCSAIDTLGIADSGKFPQSVVTGTKVYIFARGGSTTYGYRVIDLATGVELQAKTTITPAIPPLQMRAAAQGGLVWLYYGDSNGQVAVAKFDPSSVSTAPVVTTYLNANANTVAAWDIVNTVNGLAFGAILTAAGTVTGGSGSHNTWFSYLNTATGGATSWVSNDIGSGSATSFFLACWARYDGTNGSLYFLSNRQVGSATFTLATMSATNFGSLTTATLGTLARYHYTNLVAYFDGTNVRAYWSDLTNATGTFSQQNTEDALVTQYTYNGASTTTATWVRGEYLASVPFKVGSTWYVVTGHDDKDDLQRCYAIRNASTKKVVGKIFPTRGGAGLQLGVEAQGGTDCENSASPVTVSGTTAYLALSQTDTTDVNSVRWTTLNFADTYGPLRSYASERQVLMPGFWPAKISAVDSALFELAPMMYPSTPTATITAATGTFANGAYEIKATYAFIDGAGNITRSSESPPVTATITATTTQNISVVVRNLRMTNGTAAYIELWMTAAAGSTFQLMSRVANDSTANTTTFTLTGPPSTDAEDIYTSGGVLTAFPPPPHRSAAVWRDRLWLFDTDTEGEVWFSKEFTVGNGVQFAPPLRVTLFEGRGRVRCGGAISQDYLAVFKENAVYAIGGAGPDDTGGGGGYQPLKLGWSVGCTNPASVVTYPGGCLYQGPDNRIYRIDSGLQGSVMTDADDLLYAVSGTITAATHLPAQHEVRFWLTTGVIVVYDYGNVSEQAPNGYWYQDSGPFTAAVGATTNNHLGYFVDATGVVWYEVVGHSYDDTSTAVLAKLKLSTIYLADLLGELRLSRLQFLGEYRADHTLQITLTPDYGTPQVYSKAMSAEPELLQVRPSSCGRISALDVTIEETGTGTGAGFYFDGLMLEVQLKGTARHVNSTQRM